MTEKVQIDPTQWKALFNATSAASAYVASASGGGLEMFKELFSASKFMVDTIKNSGGGYGELVDAFLEKMKGLKPADAKENTMKYDSREMEGIRAEAKQRVVEGVNAVASMPDADGFKRWLLEMARQVARSIRDQASDLMMPDLMKVGGVSGWIDAAAICAAASMPVSNHFFQEISVHMLAVTPTADYLEYFPMVDALLQEPLQVEAGVVQPPERPGNGIEWREESVDKYRF